jgi:hypothetical protein
MRGPKSRMSLSPFLTESKRHKDKYVFEEMGDISLHPTHALLFFNSHHLSFPPFSLTLPLYPLRERERERELKYCINTGVPRSYKESFFFFFLLKGKKKIKTAIRGLLLLFYITFAAVKSLKNCRWVSLLYRTYIQDKTNIPTIPHADMNKARERKECNTRQKGTQKSTCYGV